MKVSDIMCRKVVTVTPKTSIRDIWRLIFIKKINALPVIDIHKKLVGIIAEDDLLTLLYPSYEEYLSDFTSTADLVEMERKIKTIVDKTAKDVMKKRVIVAHENIPIMRALSRMIVRHVNQLPVLGEGNKLVGIITKGDVFNALFKKRLRAVLK